MQNLKKSLTVFFSFLGSLLTLACRICFCYLGVGALLSATGLGFLVPLGANIYFIGFVFLLTCVFLALLARQHGKFWILIPAVAGIALIFVGRFVLMYNPLIFIGLFLLIGSTILNLRFKRSCCVNRKPLSINE